MCTLTRLWREAKREEGSALLELALSLPILLLLLVGAVDFGRAFHCAIEVSSAAQAGALYGAQNPTDTAGMIAAAKLEATDQPTLVPTATHGCECSDGSKATTSCGSSPSCTYNPVDYVQVNTTATYSTLMTYPGIPSTMLLTGMSRMRAPR